MTGSPDEIGRTTRTEGDPGLGRPLIILNPRAGKRGARRRLEGLLARHGVAHELVVTRAPGHARELASRAAERGRLAVAAGGDGTAHEVVNGVFDAGVPEPAVGLLPLGTGNDFVRTTIAEGRSALEHAIRALQAAQERRIDVGQVVGGDYFLNVLGAGFDAEVVRRRGSRRFWWPGYFMTIARAVVGYRARHYKVAWHDGRREGRAQFVAAMNGRSLGGGFRLAPDADPADGRLDVCWVDPIGFVDFLRYVGAVRRGTHTDLPIFHTWRTDRLSLESDEPIDYQIDGEFRRAHGGGLELRVHARKLRLIV